MIKRRRARRCPNAIFRIDKIRFLFPLQCSVERTRINIDKSYFYYDKTYNIVFTRQDGFRGFSRTV